MTVLLARLALFLLEHADLIEDLVEAIHAGANKDQLKAAIRKAKVQASDAAFAEELGIPGPIADLDED